MVDAMLSAAARRIMALIEEQARYHVNLVRGAEKEVLSLAEKLKSIRNALDDAENRRFKDKNINYWMSRLEATSHDMEDVLDEWEYAILKLKMEEHVSDHAEEKVCSFIPSSLCFKKTVVRHQIAKKILNVKEQLDEILKEKDQYGFVTSRPTINPLPESWRIQSTSMIDIAKVHGRDMDRDILVSKLTDNCGNQDELGIQVVSIVGVGGLGKTTLAQLVYNHSRVEESFDLRIWICVSDPFDLAVISKGILESIVKGSSPNTDQLDVLFKHVKEFVLGKKFLLVLDDVWIEDYNCWEPLENSLKCGGAGSKILVTTRNERVVKMMGAKESELYLPRLLSDEDCWLLLCRMALYGRSKVEFEDIGMKIAKKCNGLPLASKTLGSLLNFKSSLEEWKNVLASEIWEMKEAEVYLFPHLLLSYNELPPTLKLCFSYCAIFPKDSEIVVESLIENWMALGYLGSDIVDMELKGREYFDILAMRSLFQDFERDDFNGKIKSCKMHDIVHDFAQFLRNKSRAEAKSTTCRACDPSQVFVVNELSTLYCDYKDSPPHFCDCLLRLRVLRLTNCGLQNISQGTEESPPKNCHFLVHLKVLSLTNRMLRNIPQGMKYLIHLRWLKLVGISKLSHVDLKIIFQLYNLQTLGLINCVGEEIPMEIGNLIHLRRLDLSRNWFLKELPKEIGNLIHLRRLDLSWNISLKELPSEIENLIHLRHINLSENGSPEELPESICRLQELQTLKVDNCSRLCRFPKGLAQLTNLRSLDEFRAGSGWSKLGLLKNINHLGGSLRLYIRLGADDDFDEMVEDARGAELRNKMHIEKLQIIFIDQMIKGESSSLSCVRMDVLDALKPHPNLRELEIQSYEGSELPRGWMVSPLNQLSKIFLNNCHHLTSFPSLGKLPCLEEMYMFGMGELQFVGREFLGIVGGGNILNSQPSSNTNVIVFPKLKKLGFWKCPKWKEWEDITVEEENSAAFQVMPCLTVLHIERCDVLTGLPHRLLRKVSSLKRLHISGSTELQQRYGNKDGSDWKFISQNNPNLQLSHGS